MGRQWRQRPIACQSCRRRKIRCSRQFPCSNCTSRGLRCVQFYEPLTPAGPGSEEVKITDETKSADVTNSDIQSRLDRLETWITGLAGPGAGGPSVEKIDVRPVSRHAQPLSPPLSSTVQHLSEDALWFGGNFLCKKVKCAQPVSTARSKNMFIDSSVLTMLCRILASSMLVYPIIFLPSDSSRGRTPLYKMQARLLQGCPPAAEKCVSPYLFTMKRASLCTHSSKSVPS